MRIIRKQQKARLAREACRERLSRLKALFRRIYPDACEQLGEAGLTRRIETGIEMAERYGLHDPNNHIRLIHLIFQLDQDDLDTSPDTPWAGDILKWIDTDEFMKIAALEKRVQIERYG